MYSAILMNSSITKSLGGNCRVNLISGHHLNMAGDHIDQAYSCDTCHSPCEHRLATELVSSTGKLTFDLKKELDGYRLIWACPGCSGTVSEHSDPLSAHLQVHEIEADPLCHRCRIAGKSNA